MPMVAQKVVMKHAFKDGKGSVPAHQHPKGGGWVANTAIVDSTVYVGPDAEVYGKAQVRDFARLEDQSHVCDDARVSGHVTLTGNTWIFEKARVFGVTHIRNTRVCGSRQVADMKIADEEVMS
jgi:UDP-3-O-[3-hydroxymyristoyl] glucosamine N-acyltransferase